MVLRADRPHIFLEISAKASADFIELSADFIDFQAASTRNIIEYSLIALKLKIRSADYLDLSANF